MTEFKLPDIGEGIVECEVVEWRVAEGDAIAEDQPVVEVMTDKALVEITAPEAGRVTALHVAQGEMAKVHAPLFAYETADGEPAAVAEPEDAEASAPAKEADADTDTRAPRVETPAPQAEAGTVCPAKQERPDRAASGRGPYGRIPASPAVRRLVREHDLRLEDVPGSGKDGRVLKEDVLALVEQGGADAAPAASGVRQGKGQEDVRVEPLRGVRAAMARRMATAAATVPHFQYGEEIDVTELLALRERLVPRAEALGVRLTLMPFFMKALALAVGETPRLNSRLGEAGDEILYLPSCNVGMAVDGRAGLLVPNVKGVERRSLLDLAREVARLTEAAREGRVARADLEDGTISLSNIGALGGTYAAPIVNVPEVAIGAIGRSQWLPRFDAAGEVTRRAILTVTWAGDHRVLDGGTIARFCNAWKGYLEDPESMLLHLA